MLPPRLSILPAFVREFASRRTLPREPEPDLVMDSPQEVEAYTAAGRTNGIMAASYLFNTARISQVIQGAREVIDLACGPATQLVQIAELNPTIQFHGIDLSQSMLEQAQAHIDERGLKNVRFTVGDITRLDMIETSSADAVISTMALHHLPTLRHLQNCFSEIRRVLKPDGAIYLVDFGRFKSLKTAIFFAYLDARSAPHLFLLDYERSLRAAFTADDLRNTAAKFLPDESKAFCTFMVPMLVMVKTADRELPVPIKSRLIQMRAEMPWRYRRDLDSMRIFLGLGGLGNDPFA